MVQAPLDKLPPPAALPCAAAPRPEAKLRRLRRAKPAARVSRPAAAPQRRRRVNSAERYKILFLVRAQRFGVRPERNKNHILLRDETVGSCAAIARALFPPCAGVRRAWTPRRFSPSLFPLKLAGMRDFQKRVRLQPEHAHSLPGRGGSGEGRAAPSRRSLERRRAKARIRERSAAAPGKERASKFDAQKCRFAALLRRASAASEAKTGASNASDEKKNARFLERSSDCDADGACRLRFNRRTH